MKIHLLLLSFVLLLSSTYLTAQKFEDKFWTKNDANDSERTIAEDKQKVYSLALTTLKNQLKESHTSKLSIPYPNGTLQDFELEESPIMAPALAKRYPNIKTYSGKNSKTGETIRLDVTKKGFHAIVYSSEGVFFIDPIEGQKKDYQVYFKKDLKRNPKKADFIEGEPIIVDETQFQRVQAKVQSGNVQKPSGTQLRTYRIAVAATGEYTQFHGGTVEDGLSAIVTTMNRVNSIYEKEIAVRMVLVENNDEIIFTDAATDPFTNDDPGIFIDENQNALDSIIGNDNYDIGHGFSTGAGGLAGLGVVCRSTSKGKGVTGISQPIGDPFAVDYVSHEIGHQFGAPHTFNGTVGSCSGTNRNPDTAYEPGSGSTIMAYAGICGSDNIQNSSDPYFHSTSLNYMNAYSQDNAGNNCAVTTNTGNNLPVVEAGEGGFTIPINTPFQLNGSATDADGDALTYAWEQFDLGPAGAPNLPEDNAPLFRSFNPKADSFRIFPQISDIINNTQTLGEILPFYSRDLTFRLTVRDNQAVAGVNYDEISFSVSDQAGPFTVSSVTGDYNGLNFITVNWEVNNTNVAPINAEFVDIYVSTDGGLTFTEKVLENTPNDGSEPIQLPNVNTTEAKIKIAASNNIFFNMSPEVFTITETTEPDFALEASIDTTEYCPNDEVTFTIKTSSLLDYNESINLSVSGITDFEASFDSNTLLPGESTTLRLTNLNQNAGDYAFMLNANTVDKSKSQNLSFSISNFAAIPTISFPIDADNNLNLNPTIVWEDNNIEAGYLIEIASDAAFTQLVESSEVLNSKEYQVQQELERLSTYYVRVKAENYCGESSFSNTVSFSTADIFCEPYQSEDLPLAISSDKADTIHSSVTIPYSGKVESISISNLIGTHTYISDLTFILESPAGTQITLVSNICSSEDDFNLSLDDNASTAVLPCPPTDQGIYQPEAAFSAFKGEETGGDWILHIVDQYVQDGGELQSWTLDLCVQDVVEPTIIPPSNLTAQENLTGTVEINWVDNSDNETSYIIERSDINSTDFREIARVDADVTTYSDSNIEGETQYYYRVKAVLDIFSSDYSNISSITTQVQLPPAPLTLIASNLDNGNVFIQWTNDTDLENGFILERSKSNNLSFELIDSLAADTFSYVDESVEAESTYFYRVKGYNENGDGDYSEEVQIETLIGLPVAPSNLTFELINDSTVRLNWTDNAGNETLYRVERAQNTSAFITIADLEANSTSFEEVLNSSGTYTYRVLAKNSRGNSGYSNEISIELSLEDGVLSNERALKSKFTLFPNPAVQTVFLKNESKIKVEKIQIRNAVGQTIRDVEFTNSKEIEISVQNLSSGVYFVYVQIERDFIIKQIIIE